MSGTDAGNYTLSNTTATTTATILKATSTTSVASSADPSNAGATVTFTATISPQLGGTPTGSVSFYDGATLLGSGGLTGGQASYQTSTLSVGTHSITAVYGGDGNFNGSDDTQTPLTQTVNQTSTTTALTSSSAGDTSTYGDSVTLTASVVLQGTTTAVTGGSVTFIEGGTCSAPSQSLTGPVALNSNGQALLTTSTLAAGSDTITACYGGTATLNPSSANVTQTVNKKILTVSTAWRLRFREIGT